MKILLLSGLLLTSCLEQDQPKAVTLHWSKLSLEYNCSIYKLYDGHEKVGYIEKCGDDDWNVFVPDQWSHSWGSFDAPEPAKTRAEEVYRHRNDEDPKPKKMAVWI